MLRINSQFFDQEAPLPKKEIKYYKKKERVVRIIFGPGGSVQLEVPKPHENHSMEFQTVNFDY